MQPACPDQRPVVSRLSAPAPPTPPQRLARVAGFGALEPANRRHPAAVPPRNASVPRLRPAVRTSEHLDQTKTRLDLETRDRLPVEGLNRVLVSSARLHRQAFDKSTRHFLLQSFSSCFCEQPDICIYAQQHILLPVDTGPPPTSLLDIPRIPLLALHRNRPPSTVRHSPSSPCRHRQRPLRHHRRRPTRPTNRRPTAPNCEHFWVFLKSKSTSASTGRALGEASPAALRRFTSTIEFGIPAIARSFFLCPFQGSGAV